MRLVDLQKSSQGAIMMCYIKEEPKGFNNRNTSCPVRSFFDVTGIALLHARTVRRCEDSSVTLCTTTEVTTDFTWFECVKSEIREGVVSTFIRIAWSGRYREHALLRFLYRLRNQYQTKAV